MTMTEKYRQPEDLSRIVRELQERLDALERTNQMNRGSVGNTGLFAVGSGLTGEPILELGKMLWGDIGVVIRRQSGSKAIELRESFENSTDQDIRIISRDNRVIFEEHVFGNGIGNPKFISVLQPVGPAGTAVTCGPYGFERSVTSGTFADIFRWEGKYMNPYVDVTLNVRMSDATTAGEVRLVNPDNGAIMAGFFQPTWTGVIAAGSTADQEVVPPYSLRVPGSYDATVDRFTVQARRTAGAGTVTVSVKLIQGE